MTRKRVQQVSRFPRLVPAEAWARMAAAMGASAEEVQDARP